MQGKTLYTILLAIIAVLTLSLAVLIIFVFTTFSSNHSAAVDKNQRPADQVVVPAEEQAELTLYGAGTDSKTDGVFNLKSTKDHPNSFLMASVSIKYDGGKKNKFLEERKQLFEVTYLSQLRQATIEFFRGKSYDDLKSTDAMQECRDELKEIYGQIISESADAKIILRVVFDKWILQ